MRLEINGLTKRYGSKLALDNFSCTLENGVHILLGPNGAGKSTLMNIIADVVKRTDGTITFDGADIFQSGKQFRKKLGYLLQNPEFYPSFTGMEILKYFARLKGLSCTPKELEQALESVNLAHAASRRCGGYSGGMNRRLGIAVTLLGKPDILILDEPTAGLDPKERIFFRNMLGELSKTRIILMATHIISDAYNISDDIIILRDGRKIAFDKKEKLLEEIGGKVWSLTVSEAESVQILKKYNVGFVNQAGESVNMRIVSDLKPHDNAEPAVPELEDLYIFHFGTNTDAGEE